MSSIKINGNKIRALREEQELTQLYLATVVGVTTDTISRWENGRAPSIKKENAVKLAEALSVEVKELQDDQAVGQGQPYGFAGKNIELKGSESTTEKSVSPSGHRFGQLIGNKILYTGTMLCLVLLFALFMWTTGRNNPSLTAWRVVPPHSAPGVPFPVIIHINGKKYFKSTLLIREKITGSGEASGTDEEGKKRFFGQQPRWIGSMTDGSATFSYRVLADKDLAAGKEIILDGDIVTQQGKGKEKKISGATRIRMAPYHWADKNKDLIVSDDEILMAYETFSTSDDKRVDFTTLEELWLAGKYHWNEKLCLFETGADSGNTQ